MYGAIHEVTGTGMYIRVSLENQSSSGFSFPVLSTVYQDHIRYVKFVNTNHLENYIRDFSFPNLSPTENCKDLNHQDRTGGPSLGIHNNCFFENISLAFCNSFLITGLLSLYI